MPATDAPAEAMPATDAPAEAMPEAEAPQQYFILLFIKNPTYF